ncbi:MAG: GspE/PulE family protein, partial [Gemmatimonadales bacterium]
MTGQTTQWLLDAVGRSEPGAKAKLQGVEASDALDEIWEELADVTGTSDSDIARMVAKAYFLPVADIEAAEPTAVRFVPAEVARRLRVFPLRENYRDLVVATCDPTNLDTEQAIAFASGRSVKFEIASPRTLDLAIAATYAPENVVDTFLGGLDFEDDDSLALVEDEEADQIDQSDIESGPVVKLANLILRDAISRGASDIHIQPTDKGGVIRFRVDGLLRNYMRMPQAAHNRVVSRIKVIGGLDIADHLRPQDGRARVAVAGRNFDLRISTVPTRAAEKAVIRVLDTQGAPLLDEVGFGSDELERYRKLLSLRDGIVVVTGPTGSGKTTTLYAALRELATEDVNIMTIEDPIEYDLPGITQMQVETKQGLTFATALRAMLRQDPDIVLVGEIRDKETADMA